MTDSSLFSKDILIWDIEVSPNLVFSWGIGHKVSISYENIDKERAICCISWMVLGKKKVYTLKWDDDHNDKEMIEAFVKILENCRHSVAHNGDKFDLRWLRGRAMFHRLPMWPHYVTVDTLKVFRQLAYLNSYRLDYLLQYFGIGKKQEVKYALWKKVFRDVPGAMEEMVRYNRNDVRKLAELYEFVQPYMSPVDRFNRSITLCPKCDSENYVRKHHRFTSSGAEKIQLQCKDCDGYWTVPAGRFFKER